MKFRTSAEFRLPEKEQQLLEWLQEQYDSGKETVTFHLGGQSEDERLKRLGMSIGDVETAARHLEAWGRDHWNVNPKCGSGTPPLRVERDGEELRLIVAPQIGDICGSYKAWLEKQETRNGSYN